MEDKFQGMDDLEVVIQAQEGKEEAVSYLLEKYKGMVRALARPLFLMDGEQDDLIQEGMIGLFKAIQTYNSKKGASFETFANLCITRQMYSAVKMSNRKKNSPLNSYVSIDSSMGEEDITEADKIFMMNQSFLTRQLNPEEIVIGAESEKHVREKLFSRLSKMETQVLHLFLKGLTYQEIAKRMGKSPKTIDNALQRIKGKLSKLQKKGFFS